MKFKARIEVSLKPGHSDPEGEMTARSLRELNYPVEKVNVSKVYTAIIEAESKAEAKKMVDEMCRRLLANPTKDDYKFEIEELK
ncbi:phosphoribosylformylglycinamidine synthase, purS protein [Candidatus Bathyarchaeota archaeon]|nr:MAG: phosphoribosylformylglycinamidine synthase, purS protein [Candidatus Bathyarchaeota archaeon]